jgi:LPS-assembly lipoprotein
MWWSEAPRLLGAAALAASLAACGFEPLYAPSGPAAAAQGRVEVAVIDGPIGFAMRERLIDRLGPAEAATHRLKIDLELDQQGVALTRKDETTRFDVTATAAWRLYPRAGGAPALSGETSAVTGYSAPADDTASAFAVLSARRDAEERLALTLADRIAQDLALDAAVWAP